MLVSFRFLWFSLSGPLADYVIYLYLEIPKYFACLIPQDGFWFSHVPIGSLVKFQFLAQFPVDHLSPYYYYYFLVRVFHISVSWWFFTGIWLTASLLKSPGLLSVFWQFSIILSFGRSSLVRQLQNPLVHLKIVPNAPIPISKNVTFIFHSFCFSSLARSRYYLPTPPLGQDMTQGQFSSGV